MITILNRIFPEDISKLIYNFVIQYYIQYGVEGKLFIITMIMEKHCKNFYNIVNIKKAIYDPSTSYNEIINICKFLKYMKICFIEKKHYNYDNYTKQVIEQFKKIINHIYDNENHNLLKNYFKHIYNEI